jgi:hypothetical protein
MKREYINPQTLSEKMLQLSMLCASAGSGGKNLGSNITEGPENIE